MTRFLRAKGVDAVMFLDNYSALEQNYPWREDPSLSPENLPDWITYHKFKPKKLDFHFPGSEFQKMIDEFAKCDIALVNGLGAILAMKAKVPYLFYSIGTCMDIALIGPRIKLSLINLLNFRKPNGLLTTLILGTIQKKAIQKADGVGVLMGYQIGTHAKKLGVDHRIDLMKLPWDFKLYRSNNNPELEKKYKGFDLIYFMPTRHVWKSLWGYDFCKGNDKFIRAFAKLIKNQSPNIRLVTVEKGQDVKHSKNLIQELGISNHVEWIPELDKEGIRMYNSLSNVVIVDQFGHDNWKKRWPDNDHFGIGYSGIGYEAMSGKNLLITTFTDTEFYDNTLPPIFQAFSVDEIHEQLVKITNLSQEERQQMGEEGYQFCYKYHNCEVAIDQYIDVLNRILSLNVK